MSTNAKIWFSAKEISLLGEQRVASLPKTESGSRRHIAQGRWVSREVKGAGGPGGILTEYCPPADVLALIHQYLEIHPDFFGKDRPRAKLVARHEPTHKVEQRQASYAATAGLDVLFDQQAGFAESVIRLTLYVRNHPQLVRAHDDLHQRVALMTYRSLFLYGDADLLRINKLLNDTDKINELIKLAYEADCMKRGIAPGSDLPNVPWYQIKRKLLSVLILFALFHQFDFFNQIPL